MNTDDRTPQATDEAKPGTSPELGELAGSTVSIAVGQHEALLADKARLDYLDECNRRLNEHCGTVYGWKLVQTHLVNRLMRNRRPSQSGHVSDLDLHDSQGGHAKHPSCREAIDEAMSNTPAQPPRAESK